MGLRDVSGRIYVGGFFISSTGHELYYSTHDDLKYSGPELSSDYPVFDGMRHYNGKNRHL